MHTAALPLLLLLPTMLTQPPANFDTFCLNHELAQAGRKCVSECLSQVLPTKSQANYFTQNDQNYNQEAARKEEKAPCPAEIPLLPCPRPPDMAQVRLKIRKAGLGMMNASSPLRAPGELHKLWSEETRLSSRLLEAFAQVRKASPVHETPPTARLGSVFLADPAGGSL